MVLKLYGFRTSAATRYVTLIAKELDIKYEFVNVDLVNNEQGKLEHKANQPFGKVPYIDDDGFILYESRAIVRYLAAKTKSPLLPTELKAVARFEQAASIEMTAFVQPLGIYCHEMMYKKLVMNKGPNEEAAKEAMELFLKNIDVYEVILGTTKYLAGDEVTLADLLHIPSGTVLTQIDGSVLNNPSRPNVSRWWNDISNRPSWLEVLAEST